MVPVAVSQDSELHTQINEYSGNWFRIDSL
jgi:hypothetical protein